MGCLRRGQGGDAPATVLCEEESPVLRHPQPIVCDTAFQRGRYRGSFLFERLFQLVDSFPGNVGGGGGGGPVIRLSECIEHCLNLIILWYIHTY